MILAKDLNQVTLEKSEENVTGKTGLSFVCHCLYHFGFDDYVNQAFKQSKKKSNREKPAKEKILASVLTSIAGGECVEDLEVLRADRAFLGSIGLENIVGADAVRHWQKEKQTGGKLRQLNELISLATIRRSPIPELTYDNDATYFASEKDSALYSYHGEKEFSGLLGFIPELGICNTVDFRPGNISPATGILNQLRKANRQIKIAGKKLTRFRSDSAAHQQKIFDYCNAENILYYVSLAKNQAVQKCIEAVPTDNWATIKDQEGKATVRQWTESVYVLGTAMRILILRWPNPQPNLFNLDKYCYHVIATNDNNIKPLDWLEFHNGRMGSENYNKELKYGFNSDYSPSHDFNQNRAYFLLKIIAYNFTQIMKLFYLSKIATNWTIKTLRYKFINVCGKLINHARKVIWKIINVSYQTFALFRSCLSKVVIQI
jgi:hypothetical protein